MGFVTRMKTLLFESSGHLEGGLESSVASPLQLLLSLLSPSMVPNLVSPSLRSGPFGGFRLDVPQCVPLFRTLRTTVRILSSQVLRTSGLRFVYRSSVPLVGSYFFCYIRCKGLQTPVLLSSSFLDGTLLLGT